MAQSDSQPPQRVETVLAFDYGLRWIGVAVGQSLTGTANPLPTLKARDGIPDWEQIAQLLEEWQPTRLVVGRPLNMDGSESELSQRADKFARRLHGRFGLPVAQCDERLSSFEAKGQILEQKQSRDFKAKQVDSLSAVLILESWFREDAG